MHLFAPAGGLTENGRWGWFPRSHLPDERALRYHLRRAVIREILKKHASLDFHSTVLAPFADRQILAAYLEELEPAGWEVTPRRIDREKLPAYLELALPSAPLDDEELVSWVPETQGVVGWRAHTSRTCSPSDGTGIRTLPAIELVRRILRHELPGYREVRHYGFLTRSAERLRTLSSQAAAYAAPYTYHPRRRGPSSTGQKRCTRCGLGLIHPTTTRRERRKEVYHAP